VSALSQLRIRFGKYSAAGDEAGNTEVSHEQEIYRSADGSGTLRSRRRENEKKDRRLHVRAMNILDEGLKEKGALLLMPSRAVESMGSGGMLGSAALWQQVLSQDPAAASQGNGSVV
jgi:hypothetical protein